MLLVLDNCEHLLVAAARIVAVLLRSPGAENLRVVATSRQALGVEGETVWRVPSLDVPDPGSNPGTDEIAATEGVRLFCQRAQSFTRRFLSNPPNPTRRWPGLPTTGRHPAGHRARRGADPHHVAATDIGPSG